VSVGVRRDDATMIPLTDATAKRVRVLFRDGERVVVAHLLASECGDNLRVPLIDRADLLEKIRFAVLKLSGGSFGELQTLVEAAKLDWRDLVRRAGFAEAHDAHRDWYPTTAEPALAADAQKDARG